MNRKGPVSAESEQGNGAGRAARALERGSSDLLVRASGANGEERRSQGTRLVYASRDMAALVEMIRRLGAHDLAVLITGESGVGKELIAEELVRVSRRADRPFVRFNCAALTAELAEAELFGHRRGAFTGAVRDRTGLFREADGGTLFLDEVGELQLQSQAKLLRVLQEGEVRPVGTSAPVHVDVRIIAASNRSLPEEVAAGRFREDLYYRLSAAPLRIPALRERPDDILALARHFVSLLPRELNLASVDVPLSAYEQLLAYAWPGNVRELRNALQRALILSPPGTLDVAHLPGSPSPAPARVHGGTLKEQMESLERSVLVQALERAGGNRSVAARDLDIARSTLYVKLVRHGLAAEEEAVHAHHAIDSEAPVQPAPTPICIADGRVASLPRKDAPLTGEQLGDSQGRHITYLRLSLTDRCNYRCSYCSHDAPARKADLLSRPEIKRLVSIFARLGVRRVRLTGGEPTLRRDLLDIAADAHATPGIEEIALTTNGHFLADLARHLRAAGISRLNVSLDTLKPSRLCAISGRGATLDRIVRGLADARSAGFDSLKLNTVVLKGLNEDELGDLVRFAWRNGATPRFIELMPFGAGTPVVTADVKRLIEEQGVRLTPDPSRGWGPARYMSGVATGEPLRGLVGFIGAMTETFCEGCNRVRVGPTGALRACLGGRDEVALAPLLRGGARDEEIADRIIAAVRGRGERHHMADGQLLAIGRVGG